MSRVKPTYPFPQLGYETLVGPPAPINYCFPPNCPNMPFPLTDEYDPDFQRWYADKQQAEYSLGLQRLMASRQVQFDHFPYRASPVFNSNMTPLSSNYMEYDIPLWIKQAY
jgi:hypothetical protein